jgi:hypothetical protein
LYGSFNGSLANVSTQHWTTVQADGSSAKFNPLPPAAFSGSIGKGGFAMAQTGSLTFPTTWGCRGLIINAKKSNRYEAYTLSFGSGLYSSSNNTGSYSSTGYKAKFRVSGMFKDVYLPFEDFSRAWPAPGVEPKPNCLHDTSVCPTFMQMQNLEVLKLWAEGSTGEFGIEIQSIRATSCYQPSDVVKIIAAASDVLAPPDDACIGACFSDGDCSGSCPKCTWPTVLHGVCSKA